MPKINREDSILIEGYLAGKPAAIDRINTWISSVVRHVIWDIDSVDDARQDAWLNVARALPKFEGRCRLKTYVCKIASYVCLNIIRDRQRRPELVDIDGVEIGADSPSPIDEVEAKECLRIMKTVIAQAAAPCRDLWRLIADEGLPYDKIAEIMSIELGTVKSRVSRCREKALALFRKYYDDRNSSK